MPKQPHTKERAPRRPWSRQEIETLVWVVSLYQYDEVDFEKVARKLFNRSACDVRKRWAIVRAYVRRKLREAAHAAAAVDSEPAPYSGELHASLKWVETQWWDLEYMLL